MVVHRGLAVNVYLTRHQYQDIIHSSSYSTTSVIHMIGRVEDHLFDDALATV